MPKQHLPILKICSCPCQAGPKEAVCFEEKYHPDLSGLLKQYDGQYATYLWERPRNSRIGDWTEMAADFYRAPYCHYPEVPEMLAQQGFLSLE